MSTLVQGGDGKPKQQEHPRHLKQSMEYTNRFDTMWMRIRFTLHVLQELEDILCFKGSCLPGSPKLPHRVIDEVSDRGSNPTMIPAWPGDLSMAPSWLRYGTNMVPAWPHHGLSMTQAWLRHDPASPQKGPECPGMAQHGPIWPQHHPKVPQHGSSMINIVQQRASTPRHSPSMTRPDPGMPAHGPSTSMLLHCFSTAKEPELRTITYS